MMELPSYYLKQPAANWDQTTIGDFEKLYRRAIEPGKGDEIEYLLSAPKWQFLCYLCDHKSILLHGSGQLDIGEFEPRQSNDIADFGNRCAVYAASDGIWPIYFAIVDRDKYVTSLTNACFRLVDSTSRSQPYYFFSINGDALPHYPWHTGMIYLLPRASFEQQANEFHQGAEIEIAQWASLVSVKPLAKLRVQPSDFPFLTQVLPHDPAILRQRALADPHGFPWMDDAV